MKSRPRLSPRHIGALAAIAAFAVTTPAQAHHPMGGATPGNWMEGLLSGWGHPIIGADHLLTVSDNARLASRWPSGNGEKGIFRGLTGRAELAQNPSTIIISDDSASTMLARSL